MTPVEIIMLIIVIVTFVVAIFGLIAPGIPSLPVAWIGILAYAAVTDFAMVDLRVIIITGIIALIGTFIDFLANIFGAKVYGASKWGIGGAVIGSIVGLFFIPPFGVILGAFLGAFGGEYYNKKETTEALRAAWGTFLGFILGTLIKVILIATMIVLFFVAAF